LQSTKWSVSNSSVVIDYQQAGVVRLLPQNTGTVTLTGEISMVTGGKRTVNKTIIVNNYALSNIKINGESEVYVFNDSEIKYKLTGAPSGTTVNWETNNASAEIVSGQGTNEVTVKVKDITQFRLSANAQIGNARKTVSKDISVNYINAVMEGDDNILSFGQEIKYKINGIPEGTVINWQTNNTSAEIINGQGTNEVSVIVNDISQFKLSATLEYGGAVRVVEKNISVSYFKIEGEEVISYRERVTYKILDIPNSIPVKWTTNHPFGFYFISGQGTNEVTVEFYNSLKNELIATFQYLDKEVVVKKEITIIDIECILPEIAKIGDSFTCKISDFDALKRTYPDIKIEWETEVFAMEQGKDNVDLITEIDRNDNLGEITFKGNKSGLIKIWPNVTIKGKKYKTYFSSIKLVNIGGIFCNTLDGGEGTCALIIYNIPNEVDLSKIEWLKVNEQDTYILIDEMPAVAGQLNVMLAFFTETSPTNNARAKVRLHYYDGRTQDIISPILPFRETEVLTKSSTTIEPFTIVPQQVETEKIYNVEVYVLPQGNKVYSKKNVINFNIHDLLIPNGAYSIRKTDKNGNITQEKVYKK